MVKPTTGYWQLGRLPGARGVLIGHLPLRSTGAASSVGIGAGEGTLPGRSLEMGSDPLSFLFFFLGPHSWYMEVHRLGVKLEL